MKNHMWMGTRNHEQWVPEVAPGVDYTREGWSTRTTNLRGGARIRASKASHRVFNMEWPGTKTLEQLRPIQDYASGVYDFEEGTNLIYFITPDMRKGNAAPQMYAFPGQSDGMSWVVESDPTLTATPANTLGYPARSAVYNLAGTETARPVYIPIPPGYTAHVGFHGSATGDTGFQVTPYVGATPGSTDELTALGVTDTTRVNSSYSSADGYTGIEMQPIIAEGVLTASAVIVLVLLNGQTPSTGGYISGSGHTGCQFDGHPQTTYYQLADNREAVGMTARLVETGGWL